MTKYRNLIITGIISAAALASGACAPDQTAEAANVSSESATSTLRIDCASLEENSEQEAQLMFTFSEAAGKMRSADFTNISDIAPTRRQEVSDLLRQQFTALSGKSDLTMSTVENIHDSTLRGNVESLARLEKQFVDQNRETPVQYFDATLDVEKLISANNTYQDQWNTLHETITTTCANR